MSMISERSVSLNTTEFYRSVHRVHYIYGNGRRKNLKNSSIFAVNNYIDRILLSAQCKWNITVAKVTPFPSMSYSGRNKFEVRHIDPTLCLYFWKTAELTVSTYFADSFFVLACLNGFMLHSCTIQQKIH